ncbi:hypothetical protein IU486_32600 [Streptomyces gardneri]|uniref:hypothetical protein n=1 Tax=Nocardia TaxID=1817 RepID=UPI00135C06F7|nr:hypothetical protein [Streptomyces gardneri]MBF6209319.1 hypothetical protein [Streptomyces gardneri]UAK36104.1 hypothetical protein K8O92_26405 [Nocardia asteroides]
MAVEKVSFIDGHYGQPAPLRRFSGQRLGGPGYQDRSVIGGLVPERGDDAVEHAATPIEGFGR